MSDIQPLQNRVQIVKDDGTPTDFFIRWAKQRQIDISGGITATEAQALIDAWALARDVNAGVGLSGGGNLSTDITIDLENTAVTPGPYTSADITVDAQGRITAAANGAGGGVPTTRTLTAGAGLIGGGDLSANRTFDVDPGTGITTTGDKVNIADTAVTPGSYTNTNLTVDQQGRITAASNGSGGGGGSWSLVDLTGAPITSGTTWTFSTNVTNIDVTGLAGYQDLLIICRSITLSVSGTIGLRVSTDGGSTFFATAGNYLNVATTGVESNSSFFANNGTNATAARTLTVELAAINVPGPKHCRFSGLTVPRIFVADNANNIDAIRIIPSGGGNMTGGSISVYAR